MNQRTIGTALAAALVIVLAMGLGAQVASHNGTPAGTTNTASYQSGSTTLGSVPTTSNTGSALLGIDGKPIGGTGTTNTVTAAAEVVPTGTTLQPGQIGVFENVNNDTKVIDIWAPTLQEAWTVGKFGAIHHNAWIGYQNEADAMKGACSQVEERLSETSAGMWAAGYTVKFNGGDASKACAQAPAVPTAQPQQRVQSFGAPASNIYAARSGQVVPKGTLVVYERVDNEHKRVDVRVITLPQDVKAGPDGMTHHNIWYGYGSTAFAQEAACQEAHERLSESQVIRGWAQGHSVTLEGGAVPQICEAIPSSAQPLAPAAPTAPAAPSQK